MELLSVLRLPFAQLRRSTQTQSAPLRLASPGFLHHFAKLRSFTRRFAAQIERSGVVVRAVEKGAKS